MYKILYNLYMYIYKIYNLILTYSGTSSGWGSQPLPISPYEGTRCPVQDPLASALQ